MSSIRDELLENVTQGIRSVDDGVTILGILG